MGSMAVLSQTKDRKIKEVYCDVKAPWEQEG